MHILDYTHEVYLDLEDRESVDPGHKTGEGGFPGSTHTNQQQMALHDVHVKLYICTCMCTHTKVSTCIKKHYLARDQALPV